VFGYTLDADATVEFGVPMVDAPLLIV
ncbi:uncharacterized protein METZ01_LOCUS190130, partial [marine metagenome]